MLSPAQLRHYETFGFVIVRSMLSEREMAALEAEFEQKLTATYAHRPFDGTERHWSGPCLGDDTPFMRDLTEDARFHGMAQQLHGEDVILAGVDGNRYTGDTGWHPGPLSLSLCVCVCVCV